MRISRALAVALAVCSLGSASALWLAGRFLVLAPGTARVLLIASAVGGVLSLAAAVVHRQGRTLAFFLAGAGLVGVAGAGLFPVALVRGSANHVQRFEGAFVPPKIATANAPAPRLRVVQLNVHHDYPRFDRLEERADDLAVLFDGLEPDVVVLNEVWDVVGVGHLAKELAERLGLNAVYARANGSRRRLGFEEGTAILSRFPIVSSERVVLEPDPTFFERRIALVAELDVPGHGRLSVVGTHLHHADQEIAAEQARALLAHVGAANEDSPVILVAGDFNLAAEDRVFGAYRSSGYVDAVGGGVDRLLVGEGVGWRTVWAESRHDSGALDSLSDHDLLLAELEPMEPRSRWPSRWTSAPAEVLGLDTERLEKSVQTIAALDGVECVLVARFGRLAAEGYFRGSGPNQLRNLKSVSKSVLSAVVGIAIEQGHLSIDDRIGDLLPSTNFAGDQRKAAITVGDLLTMRSGLESTSFGNYGMWISSRNWVASALARPLVDEPGTRMRYSTGDTHLLSAALTEATGESTLSFAQQHLFAPLGIDRVLWQRSPQGIYMGGNNLSMTARDMARFGQLYLDRGRWGDQQIVPWKWVDMSTVASGRQPSRDRGGYGYLWWLRPENERGAYSANGFGGQYIYISRADDLVVVIGSTETSKGRDWRRSLFAEIREGIVGSVLSRTPSEPLQEDDLGPTPR